MKIAEEDLTPERSSKAVNKCIVDLSLGRNDINDAVGRWGDVRVLFFFLRVFFFLNNVMPELSKEQIQISLLKF